MIRFYIEHDSNHNPIYFETIHAPLLWQLRGLWQTRSGYGNKLTTEYKIRYNRVLYRVYCVCYSNVSSFYIISDKQKITLQSV